MMRKFCLAAAVGASLVLAGHAMAAPLNLLASHPNVVSGYIEVRYDAPTRQFTALGLTQNVELGTSNVDTGLGDFTLQAEIDADGTPTAGGTCLLDVTGDLNGDGVFESLYHSRRLASFGYSAEDKFEFVFAQDADVWWTNGLLIRAGAPIGVILDGRQIPTSSVPSFATSFANDASHPTGKADTFAVPEPTSGLLAGAALGLLARRRRR